MFNVVTKAILENLLEKKKKLPFTSCAFLHYLLIHHNFQYLFYTPFSFRIFYIRILQRIQWQHNSNFASKCCLIWQLAHRLPLWQSPFLYLNLPYILLKRNIHFSVCNNLKNTLVILEYNLERPTNHWLSLWRILMWILIKWHH